MEYYGRRIITTDVEKIDKDNVIQVLREAYAIHSSNAHDCDYLLNYEAGEQPLAREKKFRKDIDIRCIDNVANEITEFKLGFNWGYPITLIQRGEKDSNKDSKNEIEAISLLNECYDAEDIKTKTQQLARFVEITGIGYTYVDVKDSWQDGDSYFSVDVLDPRYSFIVRSRRYIDHRPMLGVTFRKDNLGNCYFTCFSDDRRYEIVNLVSIVNGDEIETLNPSKWYEAKRSGEVNPLGMIPVVEWIRAYDRMGCFERQMPELDNLNILASDFTNDVDQNTQTIWWCNDVKFNEDENGVAETPSTNDWLQTFSTRDGKTPMVKPLAVQYDYSGMLNNYVTHRALILQKCSVPQRNDNSGGSTGIAMSDATGWSSAEASACKQQAITESSKMAEVKLVLKAIKKNTNTPSGSPLLKLKAMDVKPNIKRQKTYEMSSKANTFATLIKNGIQGKHALEVINLFEDVQQVWADSEALINKYQKSLFDEEKKQEQNAESDDRIMQDNSDQEENSPMLNGKATANQKAKAIENIKNGKNNDTKLRPTE